MLIEEKINKFFGNVNFYPTDCPYDDLASYSDKRHLFLPYHLDSRFPNEREVARNIVQNVLRCQTQIWYEMSIH